MCLVDDRRFFYRDGKSAENRATNPRRHLYKGDIILTTIDKFIYRYFAYGDKQKSFMVGDLPTDIIFGKNLGIKTIFIKTKKQLKKCSVKADYVVKNFVSAKNKILQYLSKLETKK